MGKIRYFLFCMFLWWVCPSSAVVTFFDTQSFSLKRIHGDCAFTAKVEFPVSGCTAAVDSARHWICDVLGVDVPARFDVTDFGSLLQLSCEQYFSDGNSGSRSVEIYRGYEDEDCVTFESMVKDKDTETWTSADCATFSKKDGHRLSVAEIFKCDEQQIKSLMWRYKGNLQTGVQKPEDLVIGNAGYIDGWVIVIGPADHCLGAEYRLRYPEIEPYLRLGKNGRYYSDR